MKEQMKSSTERSRSVPQLRFPEFSGEWENYLLKDVAKITSGGTPNRSTPKYWNGNIPWVTTSLIDFNEINEAEEFITKEGLNNSSAKIFPVGTVLMAMYGQGKTRGKVALLQIEATTNQACAAILINKLIESTFLFQVLSGKYDEVRKLSNDGGQKNLSGDLIKNIKLKLPQLPEQQKIATFLTAVDSKIELLQKKKEGLAQYKKGVMQQLFKSPLSRGDLGVCNDVKKHTPSPSREGSFLRFRKPDGTNYPAWEEKKLGDIGPTLNGLTGKTKENFGTGKPYIQYKQIFDSSKIDISKCGLVDVLEEETQTKVKYGDVFFTTSSETPNEIGTTSVLLDVVDEMYLNSFCFGLRVDCKILNASFAQFLFRSSDFRRKMIPLAQGSTRYNISKSSFMKLLVDLPCLEEQTQIANFLSALDAKIALVSTQIENTQQFKKGLLQQMFV